MQRHADDDGRRGPTFFAFINHALILTCSLAVRAAAHRNVTSRETQKFRGVCRLDAQQPSLLGPIAHNTSPAPTIYKGNPAATLPATSNARLVSRLSSMRSF